MTSKARAAAPGKFTDSMVAAYRDGHAAAEWELRKPVKPPRTGREVRKREMEAICDRLGPTGIGSVPFSFKRYRRPLDQGAFVVGWVDAMNSRDAKLKAGDKIATLP
jgi:hypothetical protein